MFPCEICEIFKNTFFEEHLRKTASIFSHLISHHFHCHIFHYHRKMHLYRLRILLTISLDCNMIHCLFQLNLSFFFRHIFFSSLIRSFSFFTPNNRTQNLFTTTRQILDVLFILIFIPIVIYTSLFTLNCLYLFTLTYFYLCSLYTII